MRAAALIALALQLPGGTAHAERSLPFSLTCPNTKECAPGESGSWVPTWYQRETAKETAQLEGVREELKRADAQIAALHIAERALSAESAGLKLRVLSCDDDRMVLKKQAGSADARITRRTRWALATTTLTVLLGGALVAIGYVAASR